MNSSEVLPTQHHRNPNILRDERLGTSENDDVPASRKKSKKDKDSSASKKKSGKSTKKKSSKKTAKEVNLLEDVCVALEEEKNLSAYEPLKSKDPESPIIVETVS